MNFASSTNQDSADARIARRVAVVTGASKGIGRAIAVQLAKDGNDVFVHARADKQRLAETAKLIEATGVNSASCLCDLSKTAQQLDLVQAAYSWRSSIDVWVNNAGADVLTAEFAGDSFEQKLQRLISLDVQATIGLSRLVGQRMKASGRGCLVNIGWDQAASGMGGDSGEMFATAKGAVMSFTRSLAKSMAPEVRVNCVAPGWIKTDWGKQASAEWDRRARSESLLKRWGRPEDVGVTVGFLASPAAGFINGQLIEVNGGFSGAEPS